DITAVFGRDGKPIPLNDPKAQTDGIRLSRRTPLAARLKAIYGNVDRVNAFVGMSSEPHVAGTEFGELQLAIWTKQFRNLRDSDRFFFQNVPVLNDIKDLLGVDFQTTLGDVIARNTDIPRDELRPDVFVAEEDAPSAAGGRKAPEQSAANRTSALRGPDVNAV